MSTNKSNQQRKQERLVIWAAVLTVLLSVITTLWVSGVIGFSGKESGGYKNITMTDALLMCEQQSRSQYSGKLQQLIVDDHSNRYDATSNQYKIFFTAQVASKKSESGRSEFYISCMVSAHRGTIANFDAYEGKDQPTEAIRKNDGGMFGWPINK